jgi:hypothetical protein
VWKLIGDSLKEIVVRPMAALTVFWPLVVYFAISAAFAAAGFWAFSFLPDEVGWTVIGLSFSLVLFSIALLAAFAIAPVAVNWHRLVILGEEPSWRPPNFREYTAPYAIRLTGFTLGFFLILILRVCFEIRNAESKMAVFEHRSGAHLRCVSTEAQKGAICRPAGRVSKQTLTQLAWGSIVWVLFADETDYFISNIAWIKFISIQENSIARFLFRYGSTIGEIIVNALYFLVLGRWMLTLPTSAVGTKGNNTKPPLLKIQCAMFAVYALPICLSGAADRYLSNQKYSNGYEPVWPIIVVGFVALFSFLLALTILSLAYRDWVNMNSGTN